jgi:hypothetical protein
MAESKGFEPLRQGYPPTRFPIVLLRPLGQLSIMAPQVGLEPTTDRLTADSSTTELLRNNIYGGPKWTRTIDLTLIRRAL